MRLDGARVLITGASRGIGAGLAEAFAAAGSRVALVARSADVIVSAAARLGGDAYPADLTDPAVVTALADRVCADGPVDVLVNNAGISHVGYALDTTHAHIDEVLDLNLRAPMHLTRDLLPVMLERGRGHIVNVSSMAAVMSPPGLAYYSGSKAGLSHFHAGLRQDLRGLPIGLTLVHLGSVPTDLDGQSRAYAPIAHLVERAKGRDLVPVSVVVAAIVAAVANNRPHVRLPRAAAPLPAMVELPRRLTALLFRSAPPRG